MRVRMIETTRGAVDPAGIIVQQHVAGRSYDLPDHLALVYIKAGLAELEKVTKDGPSEVQLAGPSEFKTPEAEPKLAEPAAAAPPSGQGRKGMLRSAPDLFGGKGR